MSQKHWSKIAVCVQQWWMHSNFHYCQRQRDASKACIERIQHAEQQNLPKLSYFEIGSTIWQRLFVFSAKTLLKEVRFRSASMSRVMPQITSGQLARWLRKWEHARSPRNAQQCYKFEIKSCLLCSFLIYIHCHFHRSTQHFRNQNRPQRNPNFSNLKGKCKLVREIQEFEK